MDSTTLGVAAFSLAIGFSLTEVLFWHRRRGLRYALSMLVSVGLVLGLTGYAVRPYFQSTPSVRFAASRQLVAAIERLEPATKFGITPGGAAAYPAQFRLRSMSTMTRHVWKSSDATIVALGATLLRNAQTLQRHDPALCASYLFQTSDSGAVDYTRYLDEIEIKEEMTALTVALESAANSPRTISAPGDGEYGIRTLRNRLSDRYTTADFERFDERGSFTGPNGTFACRMAIDVYREALALPPTQRAEVLRSLLSDRARLRIARASLADTT